MEHVTIADMDYSEGLDRELERRLDAVARVEREAAENQAGELAARRQTLADVCWKAVQSGARLAVRIGDVDLTGLAVYARGDLLSLQTNYGAVEVNLGAIDTLRIDGELNDGGLPVPHEAESFAARLAVLQLADEGVEVITRSAGWRGEGTVRVVARDHILVAGSAGPTYVRIDAIAAILRRTAG